MTTTSTSIVVAAMRDITQGYGRRIVLDGIDLALPAGVTALVGPNGAGKTTLMRILATVTRPRAGTVTIGGVVVRGRRSVAEARRQIGYLPQGFGADPAFSVTDLVSYAGWLRGLSSRELTTAVPEAIDRVGLRPRSGDRIRRLSAGMLQRAGIATAVVGNPRLVILDEPTVGLDPAQRIDFREMLRSLQDTAVLLSTHLIEDVDALADRAVLLQDGVFRFDGSLDELRMLAEPEERGRGQLESAYLAATRTLAE